jgi:hypothetical protein
LYSIREVLVRKLFTAPTGRYGKGGGCFEGKAKKVRLRRLLLVVVGSRKAKGTNYFTVTNQRQGTRVVQQCRSRSLGQTLQKAGKRAWGYVVLHIVSGRMGKWQ